MEERRQWKRYSIAYPIEGGAGRREHTFRLSDVSSGGVAVNGPENVKKNEEVELQIFLKNKRFTIKAVVVHSKKRKDKGFKLGARFLTIPDGFMESLEKEVHEIDQFRNERNRLDHGNLSFEEAAEQYLKKTQ